MAQNMGWIASALLIALGLAGIVLPVLPGTVLVLAGIVLGAWVDGFQRVGPVLLAVIAALAVLGWAVDALAAVLGARRAGASRQALAGAAIGTVAGLALGVVGVLVLPLVGAVAGEWLARRDELRALRVGVATWVGLMAGLLAKLVLAAVMVGLYLWALWA